MKINIIGGGFYAITKQQINTWSYLYKNVDVEYEIKKMNDLELFKNKQVIGAMKLINKTLKELNV